MPKEKEVRVFLEHVDAKEEVSQFEKSPVKIFISEGKKDQYGKLDTGYHKMKINGISEITKAKFLPIK